MYTNYIKPLTDFLVALVLVTLLSPLMCMLAISIRLLMGDPVFFRQIRPGRGEKLFTIYKFRTMSEEKDENGEYLPDEQRLKGLGRFLRSTSLDELPQLFNVLKGEMSFIGPRPLLVEYLPLYNETQRKRHDVKPGISGWAQVNGRNAISWNEKFLLDVYYVDHLSWFLDLKIIILTIKKVLLQKDISSKTHVSSEKFNGHN